MPPYSTADTFFKVILMYIYENLFLHLKLASTVERQQPSNSFRWIAAEPSQGENCPREKEYIALFFKLSSHESQDELAQELLPPIQCHILVQWCQPKVKYISHFCEIVK